MVWALALSFIASCLVLRYWGGDRLPSANIAVVGMGTLGYCLNAYITASLGHVAMLNAQIVPLVL